MKAEFLDTTGKKQKCKLKNRANYLQNDINLKLKIPD
jgi:hypothetical protein